MPWISTWVIPLQPPPSPDPEPPPDVDITFESPPPIINFPPAPSPAPANFWEIAAQPFATGFAGLAAIGAAWIAWQVAARNRLQLKDQFEKAHDLDQLRGLRERYTAIGELLANKSATVRSAGIYGISSLADDWLARGNMQEAQSCVDLLCSYMRQPYNPHTDADDLDVRDNIVGVIANHVNRNAVNTWSDLVFDFEGAYFRDANFTAALFNKRVRFTKVTFTGTSASFMTAEFKESTHFDEAQFLGTHAFFSGATFSGWVSFEKAQFSGYSADFSKTKFTGQYISFFRVKWEAKNVIFKDATFDDNSILGMGAKPPNLQPDIWPPKLTEDDPDASGGAASAPASQPGSNE